MGVYIKGMEMPKSCHACCFFGQADIWESDFDGYTKSFCKRTGSQTYDYVDKFLPNCPLVPVPKHGRLGDLDALITTFCEWGTRLERGRKLVITMSEAKQAIVDIIEDAPTVIPVEEEEA